jgi:hypothetical protein
MKLILAVLFLLSILIDSAGGGGVPSGDRGLLASAQPPREMSGPIRPLNQLRFTVPGRIIAARVFRRQSPCATSASLQSASGRSVLVSGGAYWLSNRAPSLLVVPGALLDPANSAIVVTIGARDSISKRS